MAKPRKSRRLCGSVAVSSVFNILSVLPTSLRGDGDALRLSRATSGGLQAAFASTLCRAHPIDPELRRDDSTVLPAYIRRAGPKKGSAGRSGEGASILSNRGKCR